MFLLRLVGGILFAAGGWLLAAGLRPGDGATAWAGAGLIAAGLAAEAGRSLWRSRPPAPGPDERDTPGPTDP